MAGPQMPPGRALRLPGGLQFQSEVRLVTPCPGIPAGPCRASLSGGPGAGARSRSPLRQPRFAGRKLHHGRSHLQHT